jgi:superfamily II DNA or RNA helicase
MSLGAALAAAPKRTLTQPPAAPAMPVAPKLRDYQEDFVVKVRLEFRNGHRAILLVAATGAGKTVVFSYIAREASGRGKRVLILAHRDTLIKQASRKLNENGVEHGIIMAGFTPYPRRGVQVASVQTLIRRLKAMKEAETEAGAKAKLAALREGLTQEQAEAKAKAARAALGFDLIVVDEAHLSAAKSYMDIFAAWPDARILGVTGSPVRLDGKGLGKGQGGVFDALVQGISIGELIDQAYLVKPAYYGSDQQIDLSGVKKVGGDYDSDALASVMDKPVITGSAIAQWRKHCPGVPAVAWCANVAHAKHVADEFNAAGIPALALSGESTADERDKALADLSSGKIKVISFAMLLVEGVDCPAIGAVILLRPTMSLSSYLQVIGRGLRPIYASGMPLDTPEQRFAAIDAGPKGRTCFVLDHCDLWKKHGFAHAARDWSLEGLVKKKGKKKDQEDKGIDLMQCPKCFHVFAPADSCPQCHHVMQRKAAPKGPQHVDGDLRRISDEEGARIRMNKQQEVSRARTLDELIAIGKARGYSEHWARMVHQARKKPKG